MKIIIGADFVPTKNNEQYFISADSDYLLGKELCQLIMDADFRIFNLELPLIDQELPIKKYGPALRASTQCINLYKKLKVNALTLANNHIMDQGVVGLESTLAILEDNDISGIGIGSRLNDCNHSFVFNVDGKKIGLYACVEHEFSVATDSNPGANPFDPLESYDHVSNLSRKCDMVIALYHGGKEHYRYPSSQLQRYCRKFIDKGARYVICQHSHCIGCEEKYEQGTIVYGQGNFLFDRSSNEEWKTGFLVQIEDSGITYIPVCKNKDKVRLADEKNSLDIMHGFNERSLQIQIPGFIEKNYKSFANSMIDSYLWHMSGASSSKLLRIINKLSGYKFYKVYIKKRYKELQLLQMQNYIECEAHREIICAAINRTK